jgi:hypothetical protein
MKTAAATFIAAVALAAPTAAHAGVTGPPIRFDRQVTLEPNAVATYRMNISALGKDSNVLIPCWGFSIEGPGIDLAAGGLYAFGPVYVEPGQRDLPRGAVRQPDGSYVVPESAATVDAERVVIGRNCRSVGWDFYDDDFRPQLDPYYNPVPETGPRPAKASKRLHARRLRSARRQVKGRAAQDGPVTVTLAGYTWLADKTYDLVVTVRTGALPGPTTLSLHARVLPQRVSRARSPR